MLYTFQALKEMDYIETVFECIAKDIHQAMAMWAIESGVEYDIIAVNGEWCF